MMHMSIGSLGVFFVLEYTANLNRICVDGVDAMPAVSYYVDRLSWIE